MTIATTAQVCAPTVLDAARGRLRRESIDRRLDYWSRAAVRLADMRVEVAGLEHVDPDQTYVVMSNHQSNYDIFTVYYAFPGTLRMVAKVEIRKFPLIGRAMEAAEFVFVDRRDNRRARASLDAAAELMASGVSVWIAPEGTRSRTGHMGPFKKGGFMLALNAGIPILPATLWGTRAVQPISQLAVHRSQPVSLRFHAPIATTDYGVERRDELMARVRQVIGSGLPEGFRPEDRAGDP
ncbi:MAG: 1-acyl-sn-glycerol-3-phosphate acyltransferase [Sandaracinus sp.]|nr:1-acyl-sn-glycerol-3-phosphate acyltransferase [Sandaracinus sp.]|tara:strand:+ start:1702 stop:2415 length:714 start_codon:yes stop_codon:yes gene_type:complete